MKPFHEMTSRELSEWYSMNPSRRPRVGWGRHKGVPTDGYPDKTYTFMTDWLVDNLTIEYRAHPEHYPGVPQNKFPSFALELYREMYASAKRDYDGIVLIDKAKQTAAMKLATELKTKYPELT